MTCKDCYHYNVCMYKNMPAPLSDTLYSESNRVEICGCPFTNKSLVVGLPCKIGDTVFYLTGAANNSLGSGKLTRVEESRCWGFHITEEGLIQIRLRYHTGIQGTYAEYGRYAFLTREEAEKALKEP